jgi:IS5 family transposase
VIDCFVEDGNPADSTLVERTVGRVKAALPRMPTSAVFDGGFASRENLALAKEAGIEHVVFHKKCGLTVEEMAGTKAVFRKLRNFRAGIEGCISALKRGFLMARCTWRSLRGFESFVRLSVASFNAVLLARHVIAKPTR